MKAPESPQRTTTGFSFSMVMRTLYEGIAERKFGKSEKAEILAFFGGGEGVCVYCGAPFQRWDHLVSIRGGGDTVLGNIVPACSKCDDSKRDLPFEEWATCEAPNSPRSRGVSDLESRLARISEYVSHYGYTPKTPQQRLETDELAEFETICQKLDDLRVGIESFIARHRERTVARTGGKV